MHEALGLIISPKVNKQMKALNTPTKHLHARAVLCAQGSKGTAGLRLTPSSRQAEEPWLGSDLCRVCEVAFALLVICSLS